MSWGLGFMKQSGQLRAEQSNGSSTSVYRVIVDASGQGGDLNTVAGHSKDLKWLITIESTQYGLEDSSCCLFSTFR